MSMELKKFNNKILVRMKAFDTLHFWTTFLAEQYGCLLFNRSVFTFISAQIGGRAFPIPPVPPVLIVRSSAVKVS